MKIKRLFCKYYPMKRLDFTKKTFQPIFLLDTKLQEVKFRSQLFFKSFFPFGGYLGTYIILFDLNYWVHYNMLGGLALLGAMMYRKGMHTQYRVVYSLEINKDAQKMKLTCDSRAFNEFNIHNIKANSNMELTELDDTCELIFDKSCMVNAQFLFYLPSKVQGKTPLEMKQAQIEDDQNFEKDFLSFTLYDGKEYHDFHVKIFENYIKEYNEYLIAIGKNKDIVMKK